MSAAGYSAIALDLGTTSIKAGLVDRNGVLIHVISHPAPKIAVDGGRYESDALAYADIAERVLNECIPRAGDCRILGLCSQRSSFLIWEQRSGQPVTPLISWPGQSRCSSCADLQHHAGQIHELAGLPLTPYYFAPKLRGMLHDDAALRARLDGGELMVGTLDAYLVWRWTAATLHHRCLDGGAHAVDGYPESANGRPRYASCSVSPPGSCPASVPRRRWHRVGEWLTLQASVGDQSAALYAGIAADGTEALANLGTGCFVERYLPAGKAGSAGYLRTLVYQDSSRLAHFAIEGTLNSIAAALAPYPVGECGIEELGEGAVFCVPSPAAWGAILSRRHRPDLFTACRTAVAAACRGIVAGSGDLSRRADIGGVSSRLGAQAGLSVGRLVGVELPATG